MLMATARQQIADYGRHMIEAGLTTGSGGNLSIWDPPNAGVAISPSGMAYSDITAADVPVLDNQGELRQGQRKPSSETGFHLALYRQRPDIRAVVHTHSVYATTVACLRWELPAVHYLVGFSGDKVPLAPYAPFGSAQLAQLVASHIGAYNALLLANHGLITVGQDLGQAMMVAQQIELVARIYLLAKSAGEPAILAAEDMDQVQQRFATYGQPATPSTQS